MMTQATIQQIQLRRHNMSKKAKRILEVVVILLGLAGIVLIIASMIWEKKPLLLTIGLGCTSCGLLISTFALRRKDGNDDKES